MELIFDKGEFVPTYQQEHFSVVEWMRSHPLLRSIFIHVPQGKLSAKKRIMGQDGEVKYIYIDDVRLRNMGIRTGMFNFFIPLSSRHYHGLWIELKRKKNLLPSLEEKEWQKLMRARYYAAEFAYGKDHFIKIVEQYLHGYDGINRLE